MLIMTAINLKAKGRVCSCIWVSACKRLTSRPTAEAAIMGGIDKSKVSINAWADSEMTSGSTIAQHQSVGQAGPAIEHDKQQ